MRPLQQKIFISLFSGIFLVAIIATIPIAVQPVKAQVLTDEWRADIEDYLQEVDQNTTAEIVIYIVDSLYGHGITKDGVEINDIVQLGVYIFNEMPLDTPSGSVVGIGKKEKDNGVLILIAMTEHEWRIEVGYGLEGDITDIEASDIAENDLVPNFQAGNYGEGLAETVVDLRLQIPDVPESEHMLTRGHYVYDNADPSYGGEEIPEWVIILIVVAVIVLISVGGRLGGGRIGRGGWGGSGRGGGGGGGFGGGGGGSGGGGAGGRW
jgi:uncharacterized protein